MISIKQFKEINEKKVLKNDFFKRIVGSSTGETGVTITESSTDLGPHTDTDCRSDWEFDSGNVWSFISY
ncbi:hypothetical protein [Ascidiimonas aurantiaca]|uniref:hypothetical protein n=1 Tax=Ascidiimonas aurantiaca TaxID=1685432 RepID=UPI0030ECC80B